MISHSEHTLPSVTHMLLMLIITKTECQSSFSNCPTAFTEARYQHCSTKISLSPSVWILLRSYDLAFLSLNSLIKTHQEFGTVWNCINSMKISVEKCCHIICLLTTSGIHFSQTCLCYSHLLLCSEERHLLHFAL